MITVMSLGSETNPELIASILPVMLLLPPGFETNPMKYVPPQLIEAMQHAHSAIILSRTMIASVADSRFTLRFAFVESGNCYSQ